MPQSGGWAELQLLSLLQKVMSGGETWLRAAVVFHQAYRKPAEEKPDSPFQSWRPSVP